MTSGVFGLFFGGGMLEFLGASLGTHERALFFSKNECKCNSPREGEARASADEKGTPGIGSQWKRSQEPPVNHRC